MKTIKAHFDGRVFVPEERVDLPVGSDVEVVAASLSSNAAATSETLQGLLRIAEEMPDNPDSPSDLAAQHDHYLYGTPKRP